MILKLLWLSLGDLCACRSERETTRQHDMGNTSTLSARRQRQTPKRRPRCVTFQRSEVRAPLFPIQPMLWVLFQKVLSLANGPWSHKHRDRVQRRGGGARSRQPRKEGGTKKKKKKKKKKKGELGSEWWNTDTTTETGSRDLYVAEEGDSLAPQLQQQDAQERDGATTATSWKTHPSTCALTHSARSDVRAEWTG